MKTIFNIFYYFVINAVTAQAASITYYNSNSYRSRQDNPFLSEVPSGSLFVEDFETQADGLRPRYQLSTPNATGWNGSSSGSPSAGVQEDYSEFDPDNLLGYTWTNSSVPDSNVKLPAGIHFDFTPDEKGYLPEYVGAALRGSTILGNNPDFNVILVYDRDGKEVTNGEWLIPKPTNNPNLTIEELFLNFEGIYFPGGISSIYFRDFREVDHLTYGYAIPEPSVAALAAGASLLLWRRRRADKQ